MEIRLNGEPTSLPSPLTVADLLAHLRLSGRRIAVELNGEVVPRSRWSETYLKDQDRAEIVKAVGGG
ncbi:MAG: sulfur carrier protein ThiS [Sinobacteraceae bacterium]|nr:sulfur carrier protein ThiS [Nevskiaceae bacterium]